MDIKEKINGIKENASLFFGQITDWIQENTKQAIIISGASFFIVICLLLLVAFRPKKQKAPLEQDVTLIEELLIPPSPAVPKGYNLSRTAKEKWSEEELDVWFTKPTEKEIEDLSKANDKLISDIIEAAP